MHEDDTQLSWVKSDYCGTGACVEVARSAQSYVLRSSKNPQGSTLAFDQSEWDAFVAGVRAGNFDFN